MKKHRQKSDLDKELEKAVNEYFYYKKHKIDISNLSTKILLGLDLSAILLIILMVVIGTVL